MVEPLILPFFPDWRSELTGMLLEHSHYVMAGKTTDEVCRPILRLIQQKLGFCLIHTWSVDPRREQLVLVGQESTISIPSQAIVSVIDFATSFTGEAVATRQPCLFSDLKANRGIRRFENPELLRAAPIQSLLSIPVHNIGNPHQILLVLNFFSELKLPPSMIQEPMRSAFRSYASVLAASVESNLRERAFRMSTRTSQRLSRIQRLTEEDACRVFAETVREALAADWVTAYLEDWTHKQVAARANVYATPPDNTPIEDVVPQKVNEVWKTNREYLVFAMSQETSPERLFGPQPLPQARSVLLYPLHNVRGQCRGVVRCVNFQRTHGDQWARSLSYDDVAIVEAMGQAFAPLLEGLLEAEQHDIALQILAHELRVPVVALRAVLERMEREYVQSGFRFQYPHFGEVNTYVEIMQRHVRELDLVRIGPDRIPIERRPTRLWQEVIIPAKRFIEPLLKQRAFNPLQLRDSGFEYLPRVGLDRALVTQVVFNLLENAIKYFPATRPALDFSCRIEGRQLYSSIEISIQDNGPGVGEEDASRLFSFGFRGTAADHAAVSGAGIGLWLSRAIARKHGGDLVLRSQSQPTEFVLILPGPGPVVTGM